MLASTFVSLRAELGLVIELAAGSHVMEAQCFSKTPDAAAILLVVLWQCINVSSMFSRCLLHAGATQAQYSKAISDAAVT